MARRDSASEAAPDFGSFHPKSLAAEGASQGFLSFEKMVKKLFAHKKWMPIMSIHFLCMYMGWPIGWRGSLPLPLRVLRTF